MKCAVNRSPCSSRGGFKEYVVIVTLTCIPSLFKVVCKVKKKLELKHLNPLGEYCPPVNADHIKTKLFAVHYITKVFVVCRFKGESGSDSHSVEGSHSSLEETGRGSRCTAAGRNC